MGNKSLDFLEMIKNGADNSHSIARIKDTSKVQQLVKNNAAAEKSTTKPTANTILKRTISKKPAASTIAVIDTETNWYDEVMSIGVALADAETFKCVEARYYIIDPEYRKGGMYSNVLNIVKSIPSVVASRDDAMSDIRGWLDSKNTSSLFAYNAKFDYGHMEELTSYEWFDIMRLAAYKQYNSAIPETAECCKTGRLKRGYGVQDILRMLSGDYTYCETHNAVLDAMDELKIVELMGHDLEVYEIARL